MNLQTDYHLITNITESKRQTGQYFVLIIGSKRIRLIEHSSPNTNLFELDLANANLSINQEEKGTEFNQAFFVKLKRILDLTEKSQTMVFRKDRTVISPFKITLPNTEDASEVPLTNIHHILLSEGFFKSITEMNTTKLLTTPQEIADITTHFKSLIDPLKSAVFQLN
jgi:hypothetical protein